MPGLPPVFKPFRPGQKSISAGQMNHLQKAVADSMRLFFDPRHFVRQGCTVSLKADKVLGQWEMAKDGSLTLKVGGGKVWGWDAANGRPELVDVPAGELTLVNGTNYIYLQATVTPTAFETKFICWENSAFAFATDTSEKVNTVNFADAVSGAGLAYVKIGEVAAAGGEIDRSGIDQIVSETVPLLWPWTLNFDTFACPA